MKTVQKIYSSVHNALHGIRHAYKRDTSFRVEVWGSSVFVVIIVVLWPVTLNEFFFLVFSYAIILLTELINTAFETALLKLHPERHELIGVSKDIASGAVLISCAFAVVVVVGIFLNRFLF